MEKKIYMFEVLLEPGLLIYIYVEIERERERTWEKARFQQHLEYGGGNDLCFHPLRSVSLTPCKGCQVGVRS